MKEKKRVNIYMIFNLLPLCVEDVLIAKAPAPWPWHLPHFPPGIVSTTPAQEMAENDPVRDHGMK